MPGNPLDALPSLFECVTDKAHSAQLADNEHARNVGLKVRVDPRNVNPARFRAEDELDGTDRTRSFAESVTNTPRRADDSCYSAGKAENVVLWAHVRQTRTRTDTNAGVDHRVQRCRFLETVFLGDNLGVCSSSFETSLVPDERDHRNGRNGCANKRNYKRVAHLVAKSSSKVR